MQQRSRSGFRLENLGQGLHLSEMLRPESGFGAADPDMVNPYRNAKHGRKGQRRAQELPANLAVRTVQMQHQSRIKITSNLTR